jgi:hypothetical protein
MKPLIIISCISLTSCATLFGDKNRTVFVSSSPSGANVRYKGQDMGTTPTEVIVKNTLSPSHITVSKPDYETAYRQVTTSFQPVGVIHILWWPGFIVDLLTGSTMSVDQHQMNFVLKQQEEE